MKTIINTGKCAIFLSLLQYCLFLFCAYGIGGSEIGNPVTLQGTVVDSRGTGISGVQLYLIDPTETDPARLKTDSCIRTKSGNDGYYRLTGAQEGVYSLFGCDSTGQQMFLSQITIDKGRITYINGENVIVHDTEVIRNAGTVILNIPQIPDSGAACLFIPGTIIQVPVDSTGEYLIKCPSSTIDINLYTKDSVLTIATNIQIKEDELKDITGNSYVVPTPKIISGLLTGYVGRMYTFTAGSVSLGHNHPVQYRFDWGNEFSVWSSSNQASHLWSDQGTYVVRVQARSTRDTLAISEWSEPVEVAIHP